MDNAFSGFDRDFHTEMERRAREEFPVFFASATPAEASIMDAAYVGAYAYRQAVQTPRPRPDVPVRHALEIVTNHAEHLLLFVRDALRQSEAYRNLREAEQARIERELFGQEMPGR